MISASAEDTGEGQFQVRAQAGGHTFLIDEPVSVGGRGTGPNPFDMLCAALASCTLMTMKLYAERKGWHLNDLRVRVTHHKEPTDPKDQFVCELELGNATEKQRERLLSIAARCPVHLVLERGSEVPTAIRPNEHGKLAARPDCLHAQEINELCSEPD